MCNKFFYEFRVILSTSVFQLVCFTATIFTTEAVDQRVDPDRRIAHLAVGEGPCYFSDGSLQGCFVQVGVAELQALLIPAAVNDQMIVSKLCKACRTSTLGYPCCLSDVDCVMFTQ
jgi:hypothetical protein